MAYREQIPIERGLDHTLSLLMDGYLYMTKRRQKFNRDIFETRLLGGQKAICIAGKEAASIFYESGKLIRTGVAPKRIRQTIFGEKAVQTLDGEAHKQRKAMLLSLLNEEHIPSFLSIFKKQWRAAVFGWETKSEVVLYEEVKQILTKSACNWVGIPVKESKWKQRATQLEALYDSAGAIGPRHWQGRHARNELEYWIRTLVEQARKKELILEEHSPFYQMIWFQDEKGKLLHPHIVAVELLNILRPIVAISVYITFIALALHHYPEKREKLTQPNEQKVEMFIQEVRRYYPFFPYAMARAREDFLWSGHDFRKGNLVLLDIYGTNHHPEIWDKPFKFDPERFKKRKENPYDLIPQGGGNYKHGHRCPGEWLTVEVMKESAKLLVTNMEYVVPTQELKYSMVRMPSLPKSRFIISNVKWT